MIDTPPPRIDFETAVCKRRMQNAGEMKRPSVLTSQALVEKVAAFAEKWNLSPETIYAKIQTDWLFSLHFAKDPGRQSIHQKIAADFISKSLSPLVNDFRTLPSGGNTSKWVCNGGVFSQGELVERGVDKTARTIDFEWSVERAGRTLRFYASHKFTGDEGGSQNNQYEDLKKFIDCIRKARSQDVFFLAIADGPFYLRTDTQIGNRSRLRVLNEDRGEDSRWQACTSNQVAWIVSREVERWMPGSGLISEAMMSAEMPRP